MRIAWLGKLFGGAAAWLVVASLVPALAAAGTISGTVSDDATDPLSGVQVCAHPVDPEFFWEPCAFTDSGGDYTIEASPGQYRVEFRGQPLGYVREYFDDKLRWSEAALVAVAAAPVEEIDAELAEGGRIEGQVVRRATGEPTMASVYANSVSTEGLGGFTETDLTGHYVLDGLPQAEYRIEFSPHDSNLLSQYYDLAWNSFFAEWVAVTPGSLESDVDAVLETGGRIEGTVRLAAGSSPLPGVRVCAEPAGIGGELHCVFSGGDGRYEINHLPPILFKVWFEPAEESGLGVQYWNLKPEWNYADAIGVQSELTTAGIDGYLGPPPPPEVLAPPPAPPLSTGSSPKPKRCKKGFHRKLVKGKKRCVRKHRRQRHRKHR